MLYRNGQRILIKRTPGKKSQILFDQDFYFPESPEAIVSAHLIIGKPPTSDALTVLIEDEEILGWKISPETCKSYNIPKAFLGKRAYNVSPKAIGGLAKKRRCRLCHVN